MYDRPLTYIGYCCREWVLAYGFRGRCGLCGKHPNYLRPDDEGNMLKLEEDPTVKEWAAAIEAKHQADTVNHPGHYTAHPSGVECIDITEHMNFCLGNAVKYIWRADLKHDAIEDLKKARWYVDRELARRGDGR